MDIVGPLFGSEFSDTSEHYSLGRKEGSSVSARSFAKVRRAAHAALHLPLHLHLPHISLFHTCRCCSRRPSGAFRCCSAAAAGSWRGGRGQGAEEALARSSSRSTERLEMLRAEVDILRSIQHPNIVSLYEVHELCTSRSAGCTW